MNKKIKMTRLLPYQKIRFDIISAIGNGEIKIGERLKSISKLTNEYGVAAETVRKAILELAEEKVLETRGAAGTYVVGMPSEMPPDVKQQMTVTTIFSADPEKKYSSLQFKLGIMDYFSNYDIKHNVFHYNLELSYRQNLDRLESMLEDSDGAILRWHDTIYLRSLARIPVVICNNMMVPSFFKRACQLSSLEQEAAYLGIKYLLKSGHLNIGIITSERKYYPDTPIAGYRSAMYESGYDLNDKWIFNITGDKESAGLFEKIQSWIKDNNELSAIYVDDDHVSLIALDALSDMGKKIPEDISLLSYANKDGGLFWRKQVTKVELDNYQAGNEAGNILLELINRKIPPGTYKKIPPLLINGKTTSKLQQ